MKKIFLIFFALIFSLVSLPRIFPMSVDDVKNETQPSKAPTQKPQKKRKRGEALKLLTPLVDNLPKNVPILGGCFNFTYIAHSENQEKQVVAYNFFEQVTDEYGAVVNVFTNVVITITLMRSKGFTMLIIQGHKLKDAEFYDHEWFVRVTHAVTSDFSSAINAIFKKEALIIYFLLNRKNLIQPQDTFCPQREKGHCSNAKSCRHTVFYVDTKSMHMVVSSQLIFFKCKHFFHPRCLAAAFHENIIDLLPTGIRLYPICPECHTCVTTEDDWLYQIQMPYNINIYLPEPQSQETA
jgi:hypothetical protein